MLGTSGLEPSQRQLICALSYCYSVAEKKRLGMSCFEPRNFWFTYTFQVRPAFGILGYAHLL
jgi:hypothetical protein